MLAISAAYYSVFGLSSLFAGAKNEVIILATSLEFSKLIVASYLHNHWKVAGWIKYYLTLSVLVLMVITSAGIYGFLTSAYQKTSDELNILNKRISVLELKKDRYTNQLSMFLDEKESLTQSITELSKGLSNNVIQYKDRETGQIITTTSSSTRRVLESQLIESKEQRNVISKKIEAFTDSVTNIDLQILKVQSNSEVTAEIGTLRYLSKITGKPMDTVVNWFTLLIVFVFDPLAIAMVLALNKLTHSEVKKVKTKTPVVDELSGILNKQIDIPPIETKKVEVPKQTQPKIKKNTGAQFKKYSDSDKFNENKMK
jgi:hypothetical protein